MKTVNYVPTICKGDDPDFSGHVELRVPSFDEKFDLLDAAGIGLDDNNAITYGGGDKLKTVRRMVKASEAYYIAVDIKRKSDGAEFKSFDDLSHDGDTHAVLQEIANDLASGLKVGKN